MRSLLAPSLADAIFNSSPSTDTAHQYKEGKVWSKSTETSNTKWEKKEMLGWLNASLTSRKQR